MEIKQEIRFSHRYFKLKTLGGYVEEAHLLAVIRIDLEDLPKVFKTFDCIHSDGKYPLPDFGEYMLLLFQKSGWWSLFPTLRRYTPSKFEYYNGLIGQTFKVIIKE
ncbi:hypothetical protein CH354_10020 [Leptospira levettii]|uniref:hypothetical protein n=1 Tax=Leptospira levettii TaxID=2023178 RepID=UPI000C2AC4EB|nr:hypothetical protein [Leptospira levettii]PJZ37387.1 hypothetical protein CH354_10020 [Leptospira levettii]